MDLAEALTVEPIGRGACRAFADPRYESISGMFGGWTAAVALAAVTEVASGQGPASPSALTINYIGRVDPGIELELRTRHLGGGRSIGHWAVDAVDPEGTLLATALAVLGNRRETDGLTQPSMPEVPDPDDLEVFHPPGSQGERMVHRSILGNLLVTTDQLCWYR